MKGLMQMFKDKWLQSSFEGLGHAHRIQEDKWNKKHICKNADTVKEIFFGFKHIIEVDYDKVYTHCEGPNGWSVPETFRRRFCYPHRELGDHSVIQIIRGEDRDDEYIFERNEFGRDAVFIATNNETDATFIALKYK